ncbi:hypothetical protein A4S06_02340 [Erysipelotrichaceae bacterium MTC7]|nr:hypothetical protein A4S06_02340 [Erysipelotrichaceae bacterium MTC7]
MKKHKLIKGLQVFILCIIVITISIPTPYGHVRMKLAIEERAGNKSVVISAGQTTVQMQENIQKALDEVGANGSVTVTGENALVMSDDNPMRVTLNNQKLVWKAKYKHSSVRVGTLILIRKASKQSEFILDTGGELISQADAITNESETTNIIVNDGLISAKQSSIVFPQSLKDRASEIIVNGGKIITRNDGQLNAAILARESHVTINGGELLSKVSARTIMAKNVNINGGTVNGPETIVDLAGNKLEAIIANDVVVSGKGTVKSTIGTALSASDKAVIENGGKVSGGTKGEPTVLVNGAATLTVNKGGLVESTGKNAIAIGMFHGDILEDSIVINGGTVRATGEYGYAIASIKKQSTFPASGNIVIHSGIVEATSVNGTGTAIGITESNHSLVVNGGTLRSNSAGIYANGNVEINGGEVTGSTAISVMGDPTLKKKLVINGGKIIGSQVAIDGGRRTDDTMPIEINGKDTFIESTSSNRVAIHSSSNLTINDGTIRSTGTAIEQMHKAQIEINGGQITSTSTSAYKRALDLSNTSSTVKISGGTIQATGNGAAIYGSMTLDVTQANGATTLIRAKTEPAIQSYFGEDVISIRGGLIMNESATKPAILTKEEASLSLQGGAVFSYGKSTNDVVSKPGFSPTSAGQIIAWDTQDGASQTYEELSTTDLFLAPAANVYWSTLAKNQYGISYENETTNGFIELPVQVIQKRPTKQEFTNTFANVIYNAKEQPVLVEGKNKFTTQTGGLITVHYKDKNQVVTTTAPSQAGTYEICVTTTGGTAFGPITTPLKVGTYTIEKLPLSLEHIKATNKTYDGSTSVELTGMSLHDVFESDKQNVELTIVHAKTKDANAGKLKHVYIGFTFKGSAANNYRLIFPNNLTVDILPKEITVANVKATNRVYDGTKTVELTGGTLSGFIGDDGANVRPSLGEGKIMTANVGTAKSVQTAIQLHGDYDVNNYTFVQPTDVTVNISKRELHLEDVRTVNRAYNGKTSVELQGGKLKNVVAGEDVSFDLHEGQVASAATGKNKAVSTSVTLTGKDKGNYTLQQPDDLFVDIANHVLSVKGVQTINRVYDGTEIVELRGGELEGVLAGETVSLQVGRGTLDNANAGNAKAVTTNMQLTGANAANYTIEQPSNLTVDIATKEVETKDVKAKSRAYNGSKQVTLTGGTLEGLLDVDQDDVQLIGTTGYVSSAKAEMQKPVRTDLSIAGDRAHNYKLIQPTDVLVDITKAATKGKTKEHTLQENTADTYRFDYRSLLPTLPEHQQLGNANYQLGEVNNDDGLLSEPVQLNEKDIVMHVAAVPHGKKASIPILVYSDNFEPFEVTLTLTIKEKTQLTPVFTVKDLVYDGLGHELSELTFVDANKNIVEVSPEAYSIMYMGINGTDYAPSEIAPVDAGTYQVYVNINREVYEYKGHASQQFTINKRPLHLQANDVNITVGDALPEASFVVKNLVEGHRQEDVVLAVPLLVYPVNNTQTSGKHAITISGGNVHPNYEIASYTHGVLHIQKQVENHPLVEDEHQGSQTSTSTVIEAGDVFRSTNYVVLLLLAFATTGILILKNRKRK